MRFHGVDGVAFQTDSANIVNFFQRSILANDLVFRATNVAGGGIRWLGILSAGTQQGLNLQSHTAVFDAVNARNTIEFANNAFAIRGTGNIIKTGAGTLTFTNMVSEYTGSTTILDGKLVLAGAGSIASSSGLHNDGIFDISATTAGTSVRTLSGSGVVDLGTKALTLDNAADSFSGTIQGTGRLILAGGIATLTGANTFSGGTTVSAGTLQIGDGGRSGSIVGDIANNGTLAFNRADTLAFDGVVSGTGAIRQIGAGTTNLTGDSSGFAGTTTVEAGTLSVNGVLGGTLLVAGGRLQGIGTVGSTASQAGGIIAPGNSIGTLTINGNYAGNGGLLEIETALGGDASPSDRLVVTGDTAGSTRVGVVNLGGAGTPTVEGIKVVDVGGASNGVFTLQGGDYLFQGRQAIVAGAYAYTLQKNGVATPNDGDWYLRSAYDASAAPAGTPTTPTTPAAAPVIMPIYQPGVPLYEAYGQVLQSLNSLQTLRQRVGDRFEGQPDPNSTRGRAIWARIDGAHSHVTPRFSTSGTS